MLNKKYTLVTLALCLICATPQTNSITMYDFIGRTVVVTAATVGLFYFFTTSNQRKEWSKKIKNYKKQIETYIKKELKRQEREQAVEEIKEELQTTKKELTETAINLFKPITESEQVKKGIEKIKTTFQKPSKPSCEQSPFNRLTNYLGQCWTAATAQTQKSYYCFS